MRITIPRIFTKQVILGLIIHSIALPTFATGFYTGIGASANTTRENFSSNIFSSTNRSAHDSYVTSANQLAPMLQLGYFNTQQNWLWGVAAQWKYLNYQTPNENSSNGQHIANSSFSSINFFGPNIERDFASETKINNEFLFLAYFGLPLAQGYGYFGLGPALLTASNHIYLNSIHTPNGTGDHLISTSVNRDKVMWGSAAQIGYNYFFNPCWFMNINYTYLQTATTNFNNTVNAAIYNGASAPGPTTLTLKRDIRINPQEVMISINRVF